MKPKYPGIKVKLIGDCGNAFYILGKVRSALKRNGIASNIIKEFTEQAMKKGYDHLLNTCMEWVDVE